MYKTLYAASVMNTNAWKYWDNIGNPLPNNAKGNKPPGAWPMVLMPEPIQVRIIYLSYGGTFLNGNLAIPSADKLGSLMPAAGHIVTLCHHFI